MTDAKHILQEAIDRNTPITLMLPINGLLQPFKSRLLAQEDGLIWIESVPGQDAVIDTAIRDEKPLKVGFQSNKTKIEFASAPAERVRGFKVNGSLRVEAIGLAFPDDVQSVQRRLTYRAGVSSRADVRFRFWAINSQADYLIAPDDAQEITIDVRDLSAGGLGGTWKKRKIGPAAIAAGQRVRVELHRGNDAAMLLEGRLSYMMPVPDPDCRRVGMQFLLEPTHITDRQKMAQLGQIVGTLQREELRRAK